MRIISVIILVAANMCMGVFMFAGINNESIHIQVRLSDDSREQHVVEGAVSMMLRIFDAPAGGRLLWSTNLPKAIFHKGMFETALGSNINPLPAAIFSQGKNCYLQVEINGEIQSPRQIISTTITTSSKDTEPAHEGAYLQSGAVAFFDLPQCPDGWSELTQARGRYIVGLNPSGTLGATVGTALSDLENRPVGKHTHTINDPGHSHTCWYESGCNVTWMATGETNSASTTTIEISYSFTGISVLNEGSVVGTNSPYIQYILCILN